MPVDVEPLAVTYCHGNSKTFEFPFDELLLLPLDFPFFFGASSSSLLNSSSSSEKATPDRREPLELREEEDFIMIDLASTSESEGTIKSSSSSSSEALESARPV
jgi:hypothetical protein